MKNMIQVVHFSVCQSVFLLQIYKIYLKTLKLKISLNFSFIKTEKVAGSHEQLWSLKYCLYKKANLFPDFL